uniref:Nuclease HARBI1 n=1 Tax=Cajanus cajan TaxID=3821 RepID=A0A151SWJ4_CAJCA|nr:hypothetical protein KK1_014576 [Cajanus cajan]
MQHNLKRGKVTSAGGYSSSSNTETPIELDEYEIPTPTSRPIGQKATKRKAKGKETSNTNVVDFSGIENAIKEKNAYASRLIELKEAQERRLAYETIMKDTSNMNETQREAHEKYCNYLKQQYGNHDEYFQMRLDATRRRGLSPLQKCIVALRMLAYGTPVDFVDEYIRIGETTAVECLQIFVKGICEIFREARGFPGMLGTALTVQYTVNRTQYNMGYYLADGIYPDFATFVKTISMSQGEKRKLFAQRQESTRQDVECAFGVLQSRFAIIRGPTRFWDAAIMKNIIYACIILHNMIVEDERDTYQNYIDYDGVDDDMSRSEISIDLIEHIWERFRNNNDEN